MAFMNVKGSNDSLPSSERLRRDVVKKLTDTFELFGYLPIDTTILCYYDLLSSKYAGGSEILKEVYTLSDQGDRKLGLRYDLTVPFAKVISMNIDKGISLPFKRYEVGKVFRDGPVKTGRAREFYQCDVDVCGIEGVYVEAELLSMTLLCYQRLGIDVRIEINNRKMMEGYILSIGIPSCNVGRVILSLDKLLKIGEDGVRSELTSLGLTLFEINKLFDYFKYSLVDIDKLAVDNDLFNEGRNELKELFGYIDSLGLKGISFNPCLARGLEIYTGTVYEVFDNEGRLSCALGGGGRFDKIITNFINDGKSYPAVGISFGIVPICEILASKMERDVLYDLLIVPMGTNSETLKLANKVRERGYRVTIEMSNRKLKKVMEKANREGIPYVIVLGEDEVLNKTIVLKKMASGEEVRVNFDDIDRICEILKER